MKAKYLDRPWEYFSRIWCVLRGILAEVQPELETWKLSARLFFILTRVEESPYPAQLAEVFMLPPPLVSAALKELEKKGYLRRKLDTEDRRRYRLGLTHSGKKALQDMQAAVDRVVARRLKGFSAEEAGEFLRSLDVIGGASE